MQRFLGKRWTVCAELFGARRHVWRLRYRSRPRRKPFVAGIAWEAAPVLAESIGGLQAEGANRADQSALADPSALNDTTWANSPPVAPANLIWKRLYEETFDQFCGSAVDFVFRARMDRQRIIRKCRFRRALLPRKERRSLPMTISAAVEMCGNRWAAWKSAPFGDMGATSHPTGRRTGCIARRASFSTPWRIQSTARRESGAEDQGRLRGRLERCSRTTGYDAATNTIRIEPVRAQAFESFAWRIFPMCSSMATRAMRFRRER